MEMSQSDVEKINLITASAQVSDLAALLSNISRDSLARAISFVAPEDRNSVMYQSLICALNFYDEIEEIGKNEK